MTTRHPFRHFHHIRNSRGFTLVELLVVIAIIGILAGIVIPNVVGFLRKGQVTKAVAEIRSVDTALVGILNDVSRSSFRDLLNANAKSVLDAISVDLNVGLQLAAQSGDFSQAIDAINRAQGFYQEMFYNLLRQGKNSEWARANLEPELRQKLGNSYMELGQDSWGQNYRFWMGPMRRGPMFFRSFRVREDLANMPDLDSTDFGIQHVYVYDTDAKEVENQKTPGAPRQDDNYGFPAPKDQPVYVYSLGPNLLVDAFITIQGFYASMDYAFLGGGDDPNNWDNEQGWDNAPK